MDALVCCPLGNAGALRGAATTEWRAGTGWATAIKKERSFYFDRHCPLRQEARAPINLGLTLIFPSICARRRSERHHALPLFTQAVDAQRHHVATPQKARGGLPGRFAAPHANARRRAGGQHVARLKGDEAADVADEFGHAEDHGARVAGLHALTVQVEPQAQALRIGHLVARDQPGAMGPKVSQPLPLSQVPPRSIWNSRSLTSLTTQ